jgi:NodT family efflux transporter outer membrane factor (OMF) lipoprotein
MRHDRPARLRLAAGLLLASAALGACAVGPDYRRPTVATPSAFKEAEGWSPARPADDIDKGAWWSVFDDPVLGDLERKVEVSNQTLAAAEAAYRQARGLVAADRAQLFPTLSLTGSASDTGRGKGGGGSVVSGGNVVSGGGETRQYQVGAGASWAPDLWGKIRRTLEGAHASAQASAADIANARLTAQSELAVDYIQVRLTDAQKQQLQRTVEAYARSLAVTQNRYAAGVSARSDVLTAQTQLTNAKASLVDLDRQRSQAEHAIAVLIGQPPAELAIAPVADWSPGPPATPVEAPSALLQRRPDVAAAERNVAAANAQIGVKQAAYFPDLTLTGSYGFSSAALSTLLKSSSSLWSLGADVSEAVLDFGARQAGVAQARAAYDQAVAQYRQTVLTAFQGVEDALAAARVLQDEQALRAEADSQASQNEQITLNEYKAGTVDYTTVATAQAAALSAHQALLSVQAERMTEAVDLIQALGGGWSADELKTR